MIALVRLGLLALAAYLILSVAVAVVNRRYLVGVGPVRMEKIGTSVKDLRDDRDRCVSS